MKKNLLFVLLLFPVISDAQKFYTKNGRIEFYSKAPLEDINAINKTAIAILDVSSGVIHYSVVMKGFEFSKALMQEHFNENYVESHKYPRADFKGIVVNNNEINYSKDGTYPAQVKGKLSLHGITRDINASGSIKVVTSIIIIQSAFIIRLSDYKIKIPTVVKDNISNSIRINIDSKLGPLKIN